MVAVAALGETAERPALARRSRFLHALLLATVGLPALAFLWGMRDGRVAFVAYREPKLAALEALGPVLLAALAWGRAPALSGGDLLARLRRPAWALLALYLLWGLVTALWVEVPENLVHELGEDGLLLLLALALEAWADRDPAVPASVELGLVASLGLAAAVGIVQKLVPIAILAPIDPLSAASNPSFFGYKNPMALAVAGQLFLLARRAARSRPGRRAPLAFLLAAEVAYLGLLKSRTAWAAVAGGALLLGLLFAQAGVRRRARGTIPIALAAGLGALLFALAVATDSEIRWRAASVFRYLTRPASFLDSDRGTYLQNTLHMVRFHPLGVGLGDWQTQYPLYRRVRRDLFTDTEQVRMAHGDFVQALGETGWPGLALWLGFCGLVVATPAARCLRARDPAAGFAAAQAAVFVVAMLTDGVLEHPYGKLQFILVAFLALRAGEAGAPPPAPTQAPPSPCPGRTALRRVAAVTLAAAAIFLAGCRLRQAWLAAAARDLYQEAEQRIARRRPPRLTAEDRELFAGVVRAGGRLAATPGYAKERCDDLVILAHAELLLDRRPQALRHAREALRLHPYNPATLALLATAWAGRPAQADLWRRAHDQVLYQATRGFAGPYPGPEAWRDGDEAPEKAANQGPSR